MEDNEKLVEETENTEELTAEEIEDVEREETPVEEVNEEPQEEPVQTFTKEQVDEMLAKKLARKEAKLRKEFNKKYGQLENVVNAGLGTDSTEEAVEKLTEFYSQKGINIPKFSVDEDTETKAAKYEAKEIIDSGYDDIVNEVDDLAEIGIENMTLGEKVKFKILADERKKIEEQKELAALGIKDLDDEFKEFEKKLNPDLSLKEKYELYQETKPKKEVNTIGSMKGVPENKYKDYYSPEEIAKLTDEDLDDPRVWEAVRKSMTHRN